MQPINLGQVTNYLNVIYYKDLLILSFLVDVKHFG